jgi:hypothetical protein
VKIKENDVFSFSFNEAELKKRFEPYWCMDGRMIAKKMHDGSIMFYDTYWTHSPERYYTHEKLLELGEMKFVCNLNDVEEIKEYDLKYYDDNDIINLSYQHGCYGKFAIKKGTKKSTAKIIHSITSKMESLKSEIEFATSQIKRLTEELDKARNGQVDVYI